ncbi:PRC-barrel domain-containing protein [Bordetella sp. FB-8]|uniref:PRC-barrel domain-containing protein n=1 Tax=Bordetella sp. FB-8 TaxID=1159870 RepID=UPI0003744477|nr:PRC-barrel domain-containing protein [Bordetella sp. FB-8]
MNSGTQPPLTEGASTLGENIGAVDTHGHRLLAASKLDGETVYSSDNKDVGKVKEVMLDMHSGRIAYIVLSSGGFLGMGDTLYAIPWHILTPDSEEKSLKLSIPSEKIKDAPGFHKDSWPSMADHGWASSVHEYYRVESDGRRGLTTGGENLPGAVSSTDTERNP